MPSSSFALAAATVAVSLHSAAAFSAGPVSVSVAARSFSTGHSCISPRSGSLPLAAAGRLSRKQGALSLRAKEDFAEGAVAGGFSNKGEAPFQIRGFSLANLTLGLGVLITLVSFYTYFTNGNSVTSLGFVYGLPITLGGFALKYAEILPVPIDSSQAADTLWEQKKTETLEKIREDVTRHRYGDDAHLDTTLEKLGLVNPGKKFPELQRIILSVEEGKELGYNMIFQSIDTPYKVWADPVRIKKYEAFFGPGVNAEVQKISKDQRLVGIKLVTGVRKGTGALQDENSRVTAGGATKMETSEKKDEVVEKVEDKRSMEV